MSPDPNKLTQQRNADDFRPWLFADTRGSFIADRHHPKHRVLNPMYVENEGIVCVGFDVVITNATAFPATIFGVSVKAAGQAAIRHDVFAVLGASNQFTIGLQYEGSRDHDILSPTAFYPTLENIKFYHDGGADVQIIVYYADSKGIFREFSCAFTAKPYRSDRIVRARGAKANYDRQI